MTTKVQSLTIFREGIEPIFQNKNLISLMKVTIIGAGLAGREAAYQISKKGIPVDIFDMRPQKLTRAHKTGLCAELVCSNSFRGADLSNAVGLLKEELRILGSLIMEAADHTRLPAGGALAVDRDKFSSYIDDKIRNNPLINFHTKELSKLPDANPDKGELVLVATGPLTGKELAEDLQRLTGSSHLAFYDAISPIILSSSIDHSVAFKQSRYDKGDSADYLNLPLSKEEYYTFVESVKNSEKFSGHEEVESDSDYSAKETLRPFEGCMPIEDMVLRGPETLRFGPLKPVGLTDPRTGKRPYAVIQLRQDDTAGSLWSMVGFQTRMKHPEQLRIFRTIPGLEEAEFVRLGSVHRNTFIDSPRCLDSTLQFRNRKGLFFAGQITGTEGYVESTAGGLLAGINIARSAKNLPLISVSTDTALGSLVTYISDPSRKYFQPMNISFGLMPSYIDAPIPEGQKKLKDKKQKRLQVASKAMKEMNCLKIQLTEEDEGHLTL